MKGPAWALATAAPGCLQQMAYPHSLISHLTEDGIRAADYRETEHYSVTRSFLNNPDKMLALLLDQPGTEPK